jgi:hypothetical protein
MAHTGECKAYANFEVWIGNITELGSPMAANKSPACDESSYSPSLPKFSKFQKTLLELEVRVDDYLSATPLTAS